MLAKLRAPAKEQLSMQNNNLSVSAIPENQGTKKVLRNWYEERFDKILVQRNILLIFTLILLLLSIISIIAVAAVVNSKEFDPFVIQIDESTGLAQVVNPTSSEILSGNEALARYFIKKYIIARETYNPVDFDTEARKNVRLLSSNSVYRDYMGYIKNKVNDPTILYGQKNTTFLVVKSWSKLRDNLKDSKDSKSYMVRFALNQTAGEKRVLNKIAVVEFDYVPMELTETERDVNPIGFQVKKYRVDDDNS
ncbi:MAG: virB8 family protein [Rickettsiaceae bacterium]|nr:MAG: virB8 family protein [Rickettsiaceae bacterium]